MRFNKLIVLVTLGISAFISLAMISLSNAFGSNDNIVWAYIFVIACFYSMYVVWRHKF